MDSKNLSRTLSRLAAVQSLYSLGSKDELANNDLEVENAIKSMQRYHKQRCKDEGGVDELNARFLKRLVSLTVTNMPQIDELILSNLTKPDENAHMNGLLRAFLRSGTCETLFFKTPPKVIVNEYVKLAKDFFNSEEVGFVNALLDKIGRNFNATP